MTEKTDQENFTIPELPTGKVIKFCLVSSWDDPFYIGVSGIELFAADGSRIRWQDISTNAVEDSGNLASLLSHHSCPSSDPKRMWSCNYLKNEDLPIWIQIDFVKAETVAMIRVWNYSESRVHALRGVHQLEIRLDDALIFSGEISCAFSDGIDEKFLGDTILFTTNPDILDAVAENDIFLKELEESDTTDGMSTLTMDSDSSPVPSPVSSLNDSSILRPQTAATNSRESNRVKDSSCRSSPAPKLKINDANNAVEASLEESSVFKTKLFHMELTSNWGHVNLIGLTGIQFLGINGDPVDSGGVVINCCNDDGTTTLNNLVSGRNLTCKAAEMWLTEFDPGKPPMLSFAFPSEVTLTGISVWNYNASPEMSCAGVQCAQFYINGKAVVGAVLLRKAPGYVYFDYVQDVLFDRCHLFRPLTSRPDTRSISAFIFQLRLLSTWGDEFYIGLNGIELYNRRNHRIQLRPQNIAAFPESVNILPSVDHDPRSSDKLIDGENDTGKAHHMWLTPMLPNRYARVFIIFDCPTFVSKIRVFNYRKTPERGVRHISVSADDFIVFSGEVPISSSEETGILDICLRESL